MKQRFLPTKHFIYQPSKNWLARFLQRAGIMEILHQNQQSQTPKGSSKCEIWDGLVWRRFNGTRYIHDPHSWPFLVHWPSPFMWTGLMHMESQPGWPELDLSCSFVLISPQVKDSIQRMSMLHESSLVQRSQLHFN
ncbi:hypothetical protein O181_106926 [Austropuccinia psidii MF-1]|uniref:Uncharacterized protein n=1 Tax=Austropuccinia psidii MF-1 TaxID=1389203 RepID=A0A9Q3JRV6_9BASI|nr:hypothetical protein [Austropuccinia psidii MF-1]